MEENNMNHLPADCVERIYAGLLGKTIGVRHGSNIEGWSYESIEKVYGEIKGYLFDFKNFAADDDTNGPMFFIRAMEDYTHTRALTAQQIAWTCLNYVPYEHGFFWWGPYGKSTESTAYHNLKKGIQPPRSGSAEQNGYTTAEQIGGQIFIDTWGLIAPGNPALAAEYAQKAACVTHGGNGVYGGMFIAACISAAFIETDIRSIIDAGLSVIPENCTYAWMAKSILAFYERHPGDWRECFRYVRKEFWKDRYPGGCHIIPNSAIILLSLLYSEGDFSEGINICNMCGWDTDCNVGNLGTILGVRNGLEGIGIQWREPINDLLICSSVIGSLNILELSWCALYVANLAYKAAETEPPEKWRSIMAGASPKFHFELPGATHAFRITSEAGDHADYLLVNTDEASRSGSRSLKVMAQPIPSAADVKVFYKTYYVPEDFNDSRYDPSFSPVFYPGQILKGSVMVPEDIHAKIMACLYIRDRNSNSEYMSERLELTPGIWHDLEYQVPALQGACIEEAGIKLTAANGYRTSMILAYLDDFGFAGAPDYTIDFTKERLEVWTGLHTEVSQFTYLKGIWDLEEGVLSGSSCDFGEAYTGSFDWTDYSFEGTIIPQLGGLHNLNFRVQGAMRSYAVGLASDGKLVLYKNENGYRSLCEVPYTWEHKKAYFLKIDADGPHIRISDKKDILMKYTDEDKPYLKGQIGVSVMEGSHCHFKDFRVVG